MSNLNYFYFSDNGEDLIFKTKNLTSLEVLKYYNQLVSSTVPPPVEEKTQASKLMKSSGKKK